MTRFVSSVIFSNGEGSGAFGGSGYFGESVISSVAFSRAGAAGGLGPHVVAGSRV